MKMKNLLRTGTCVCPDGIERDWKVFLMPPGTWYSYPYRLTVKREGDNYYFQKDFIFKEEPIQFLKDWAQSIDIDRGIVV